LSDVTAESELKRYRRNWNNKVKGFSGILKEVIFGSPTQKLDHDAIVMSEQVTEAMTLNRNSTTRFGYWTSTLVLIHEEMDVLNQATRDLSRYLEQSGFTCIKEDVNALDAWLGTIPGHGSCNMRRLFVNGITLAHALPLNTIWAGDLVSHPASLLPPKSPPVFYAATTGHTPFRFPVDVAAVGHQVVFGPTGSGKSTYLGFLMAQFLRYKGAQIFVFDKDHSHHALTCALDGHHYNMGYTDELSFCPLQDLSTESKRVRAEQFVEDLVYLQGIVVTPAVRIAIHAGIEALCANKNRNLTIFRSLVQHDEVRKALQYYTLEGQMKMMDSDRDSLREGHLQTFEMNWLLSQRPEIYMPLLRYLFDQIESRLEESGSRRPTLIVLEEAWLYLTHEVFAKKIKDWLKTLRKKNARVIFTTQSLADLYDPATKTLTATTASIMESCPTKVYLPNPGMEREMEDLYASMGLSDRQVEIIRDHAIPKKEYYIVRPDGNRLIELGLNRNSIALSFIGLSNKNAKRLLEIKSLYGSRWVSEWIKECNQHRDFKASKNSMVDLSGYDSRIDAAVETVS
jgi:type IV secretion system protein VirB4